MPLVDVVITTYGRKPEVVLRAVKSVCRQTLSDIKIFIVDDNGIGNPTGDSVERAVNGIGDSRITCLRHVGNQGACASRNEGIMAGEAPYVAFLDDDDEWKPEKLELQLSAIQSSAADLAFCNVLYTYDDTGRERVGSFPSVEPSVDALLEFGNFIGSTSCALLRRAALIAAGMFDSEMPALQDYDLWVRVLMRGTAVAVDKPLLVYHAYSGERITMNPVRRYEGFLRFYHKNKASVDVSKRARNELFRPLAQYASLSGKRREAWGWWRAAVVACPHHVVRNLKCAVKILIGFKSPI